MIIKILAEGGEMKPSPALSQKLGPAGINMGQVISKVNEATKEFKGLKVPVELDINTSNKQFAVSISAPAVSELLKKEIGITKGSGAQKKVKVANASIEQIIAVAKSKQSGMLAKDLKAAVRSVVGTCVSLGLLIEGKHPADVEKEILQGKYDKEIKEERTQTSPEKVKELEEFFSGIRSKQDLLLKQEKAAKEAAEAEKTAATPAAAAPVKAAAPEASKKK